MSSNGRNGDSVGTGALKLGLGVGIGFALYMLFGKGGLGLGRGSGGFGAGGEASGVPGAQSAAQREPDAQPIAVRIRPDPSDPAKTAIELENKLVSVAELIARIVQGGRRDVIVAIRGDTRQGGWEEIKQTLGSAGIQVIDHLSPSSAAPKDPWA